MIKILFICLGNICRSPAAEGIMNKIIKEKNKEKYISCDSAGTAAYHTGAHADDRMRKAAAERNVFITHRARKISSKDFEEFDYIITMDDSNYYDVLSLAKDDKAKSKVHRFVDFCPSAIEGHGYFRRNAKEVPDPYYGGKGGFELVLDILEEGCSHLFDKLESEDLLLK